MFRYIAAFALLALGAPALAEPLVLDLASAQRIALDENPSLRAAEQRVAQAKERVKQARAAYWPRLDASASAANTWLSEKDYSEARDAALEGALGGVTAQVRSFAALSAVPGGAGVQDYVRIGQSAAGAFHARGAVDDSFETYGASLTATWTLFDGFAREFSNAIARIGAQESEAAYDEARRLLLSAVANSFYLAQLAREDIAIAESDMDFNQRLLTEAEARRERGAGSLSDVLNFEVRVNAAKAAQYRAEQSYRVALIGLAALLGFDETRDPGLITLAALATPAEEELEPPSPEPFVEYAMAHRPDVLQRRLAVERAEAGVGLSKSLYYPSVRLQASKDALRSDDYEFGQDDFSTTVGVSLSYNLFAGGARKAGVREARASQREAEAALAEAELAATEDVRAGVVDVQTAQDVLKLEQANARNVSRNRELVEKEYKAGQGSLVRLNEAQRDLTAAQSRLALAKVSLLNAWHNLRTAAARTLDRQGE